MTSETKTDPVILPRVMSELIRIALRDIEKAEAAEGVEVDMGDWHDVYSDHCAMCAAGAVARFGTGEAVGGRNWDPRLSLRNRQQFMAINSLRRGKVRIAAIELGLTVDAQDDIDVTPHWLDPAQWKSDMSDMATMLEGLGL